MSSRLNEAKLLTFYTLQIFTISMMSPMVLFPIATPAKVIFQGAMRFNDEN